MADVSSKLLREQASYCLANPLGRVEDHNYLTPAIVADAIRKRGSLLPLISAPITTTVRI